MNQDAARIMLKARIQLLRHQPFFGALVMRLQAVEDDTLNPPTLATDGRRIYYHPDWVMAQPPETVEAGVAHEIGHCMLNHMSRRNSREPKRWGHAIDYAVNNILEEAGFTIPDTWVHSKGFAGMSAEEIYNQLPPGDQGDQGKQPFDGHSGAAEDPVLTAEWQVATVQAAQGAAAAGKLPGSLKRLVSEMTEAKVDWRATLRRFATAAANDDFSWKRPNRRFLSLGLILPGLYSERMEDMTTAIDTSGSVSDAMLAALGGEVADIRSTVRPTTTRVMYCDAAVSSVEEFGPDDHFEVKPQGGGGTDFRPVFDWLAGRDIRPTCLAYLTDGYGTFPKDPPPYPVLWVMTTNVQPPWGEVVRIEL